MPDYEPNPRLFQTATDTVPVKCNRDEWEWMRTRRNLEEKDQKQEEADDKQHAKPATSHADAQNTTSLQGVFPQVFRSSLRGDDAQEIEDDLGFYFRMPGGGRVKNGLAGNGADIRSSSADIIEVTNDVCGRPPVFTLQEDRDEWDRLCKELPKDTTIAERLALLAESDCKRKGNPRSDAPELRERITMREFDAPSSAYECFHRPDAPPADRK